jgi:hypothetical protein
MRRKARTLTHLSTQSLILEGIDHNRMEFLVPCPDCVVGVSRLKNGIASLDLARFAIRATDAHMSLSLNDQEKNRMVSRMFFH